MVQQKSKGHVEQGCNKPLIHEKVKVGGRVSKGWGGVEDYEKK